MGSTPSYCKCKDRAYYLVSFDCYNPPPLDFSNLGNIFLHSKQWKVIEKAYNTTLESWSLDSASICCCKKCFEALFVVPPDAWVEKINGIREVEHFCNIETFNYKVTIRYSPEGLATTSLP
jgi:hypothetical protein